MYGQALVNIGRPQFGQALTQQSGGEMMAASIMGTSGTMAGAGGGFWGGLIGGLAPIAIDYFRSRRDRDGRPPVLDIPGTTVPRPPYPGGSDVGFPLPQPIPTPTPVRGTRFSGGMASSLWTERGNPRGTPVLQISPLGRVTFWMHAGMPTQWSRISIKKRHHHHPRRR